MLKPRATFIINLNLKDPLKCIFNWMLKSCFDKKYKFIPQNFNKDEKFQHFTDYTLHYLHQL